MAYLYTSPADVEQRSGLNLKGIMLTPTQNQDRRHVLPAILSTKSGDQLLLRQIDTGNLAACGFNRMPIVPFSPYWLPDCNAKVPATLAAAVLAQLNGEPLTVDAATPASVYEELRSSIPVEVEQKPQRPISAYCVRKETVLGRFNHHRNEVAAIASRLTEAHPQADCLKRWFGEKPNGVFKSLENKAAGRKLTALLANWTTNFQELSGLRGSLAEYNGCMALFLVGVDQVVILAPVGLDIGLGNPKVYGSLAEAVRDIAGQSPIGFERDTLECSRFLELSKAGIQLEAAGPVLQEWREEKVKYDLPYFVLGAVASQQAIEAATRFTGQAIRAGVEITELDVHRVYQHMIREFERAHRLPVQLEFFFENNHSGARTLLPSGPTNYRVSAGCNSLKIDAGIFVMDDGLFHASTDMARTVATTEAGAEVFLAMEKAVVHDIIPAIKTGMTREQIHELAVNKMADCEGVFRKHGYMPDHFSWRKDYVRDVGHVIDRQESFTGGFYPGAKRKLEPGMVSCIEIHCAYDGHSMTIEDTFIADDAGSILISRGSGEFGPDGKISHFPRR
jgi:Xaa-Pro aminopeptidase